MRPDNSQRLQINTVPKLPTSTPTKDREEDIMAANISGLRRNIKNIAHNYTDAQVARFMNAVID